MRSCRGFTLCSDVFKRLFDRSRAASRLGRARGADFRGFWGLGLRAHKASCRVLLGFLFYVFSSYGVLIRFLKRLLAIFVCRVLVGWLGDLRCTLTKAGRAKVSGRSCQCSSSALRVSVCCVWGMHYLGLGLGHVYPMFLIGVYGFGAVARTVSHRKSKLRLLKGFLGLGFVRIAGF